jgi:putative oxidoreductase
MNIALWVVQILAALAFLLAGFTKATQPLESIAKQMTWVPTVPAPFVRFIGGAEILGAIGLILPAATHIASGLTIAAAFALAFVMVSAIVFHISRKEYPNLGANVVLLALALFIAIGRLTAAPLS